jgi:hypothetical protein
VALKHYIVLHERKGMTKKPDTESRPELDEETVATLLEICEWWRGWKRKGDLTVREARPIFQRGKTVTRSVRLDKRLLAAAEAKARKERIATGGTFNALVELLLWEYLDRDPKYVEPPEGDEFL